MRCRFIRLSGMVLLVVLPGLLGCCGSIAVSGVVTYEGEPIENGTIAFRPDGDTQGQTVGGEIVKGRYSVKGLAPGKWQVDIASVRKDEPIDPSSEAGSKGGQSVKPTDLLPADVEGNNQLVDVTGNNQTLDFSLKKPAKKGK